MSKETYSKPEIKTEQLEPGALGCIGSPVDGCPGGGDNGTYN